MYLVTVLHGLGQFAALGVAAHPHNGVGVLICDREPGTIGTERKMARHDASAGRKLDRRRMPGALIEREDGDLVLFTTNGNVEEAAGGVDGYLRATALHGGARRERREGFQFAERTVVVAEDGQR